MRKKFSKGKFVKFSLTVLLTVLIIFPAVAIAADDSVTRIAGADRYDTSAQVALAKYTSADTVIIARGDAAGAYADGLAASVLAGVLDAPILLTRPDSLPPAISKAIADLGAKNVIILGGEVAISPNVAAALSQLGLTVERIGGASRFETAVEIARKAKQSGNVADYAFIVNGFAPADSLVAGPAAFQNGAPILQVTRDSIPATTQAVLNELGIKKIYIIGGTAVVGPAVESSLKGLVPDVSRIAGADRFATSVEFAKVMFADVPDLRLVRGADNNLADAIGASIFGEPVLYVLQTMIPGVVSDYIDSVATADSRIAIIGGVNAVAATIGTNVAARISELIPPVTPPPGPGPGPGPAPTINVTGIAVTGTAGATTVTSSYGTLQMSAAVSPASATNQNVTWSVANVTGSAEISSTGLLRALGNGTVTVTATAQDGSGVTGQETITISNHTAGEALDLSRLTYILQQTAEPTVIFGADFATDLTITRLVSIDFDTYTLTGNLTINTATAGTINLNGTAANSIVGNLTVNAGNATVNNNININGSITIKDVSSGTFNQDGDADDIEIIDEDGGTFNYTAGNIPGGIIIAPPTSQNPIVLGGNFTGVPVGVAKPSKIDIAPGSTPPDITVNEDAEGSEIENFSGTPANVNVNTNSDITIYVSGDANVTVTAPPGVTVTVVERASRPTANPAAGTYFADQQVTLSTLTATASIYYTTDGSTPDENSILYVAPIDVTGDTVIRAIAIDALDPNIIPSNVSVLRYFIDKSTATAVLAVAEDKTAGAAFDINIDALNYEGDPMDENRTVTVTSDKDGQVFSGTGAFANGSATVTIPAGQVKKAAAHTLTVTVAGVRLPATAPVNVIPGAVHAGNTTVTVDHTARIAGEVVTVTVTPKDAYNNILGAGETVVVLLDDDDTNITVTDAGDGTYTAPVTVTSISADNVIGATVNGVDTTQTRAITVSAAALDAASAALAVDGSKIVGVEFAVIVTLTDEFNNLVSGDYAVTITSDKGDSTGVTAENIAFTDGAASINITLTIVGDHTLTIGVDGKTDTLTLQTIIDPIQLQNATTAVEDAEALVAAGLSTQALIDAAQTSHNSAAILVNALPASTAKDGLQARLTPVQTAITAAQSTMDAAIAAATAEVVAAEGLAAGGLSTQALIDAAQSAHGTAAALVNALPNEAPKTGLQNRLTAVQTAITVAQSTLDAAIAAATAEVVAAEDLAAGDLSTQALIDAAQAAHGTAATLVNALPDEAPKTGLQNRLTAVQTAITAAQSTLDAAIAAATAEVMAAEGLAAGDLSTQAMIDAAQAAHGTAAALVNALPDEAPKTGLQNRLTAVQTAITAAQSTLDAAIAAATTAVEDAEDLAGGDLSTQALIDAAQAARGTAATLVNALPDEAPKSGLQNRLTAAQTAITAAQSTLDAAIAAAMADVVAAEDLAAGDLSTQVLIDAAQAAYNTAAASVTALPAGTAKDGLQTRLTAVQTAITAAQTLLNNINAAEDAVTAAEDLVTGGLGTQALIDAAQAAHDSAVPLVNAFPAGATKDDLQNRLTTVQTAINTAQSTLDGAIAAATTSVENAEALAEGDLSTQALIDAAQSAHGTAATLVNALPDEAPKTGLQNRLTAVQTAITTAQTTLNAAIAAATTAVEDAEDLAGGDLSTQALIDAAQAAHGTAATLVNALPDEAPKTGLLNRLTAVQTAITAAQSTLDAAIAVATADVVAAEDLAAGDLSTEVLIDASQAAYNTAAASVNALPAGTAKDGLQTRLTAVQAAITAAQSLLNADTAVTAAETLVVGDLNTQVLIDAAQASHDTAAGLVTTLPDGAAKDGLQARLTAVQTAITAAQSQLDAINAANTAVTAVEALAAGDLSTQALIDAAQASHDTAAGLVTALPDGAAKDGMQIRLTAVQTAITAAQSQLDAINAANTAVTAAEALAAGDLSTQALIDAAQASHGTALALVTALADGTVKDGLQTRLAAVQATIDTAQDAFDNANKTVVNVSSLTGTIDQVVDVEIVLSNFENINIAGISGGQFELIYDSSLVQIQDLVPGDFHTWQWTLEFNPTLTADSLAYAWISSQQFHQNARIVTFKVKLLQTGTVNLELRNLVLKDDSMPSPLSIPSELIRIVNGQITVE
ncbi:MAG: cell wall-binding repeat-containing protein [Dethiobacter sp.]|nr:cell wall-binding repeat-containing protein [Dethiobacter sp.]